MVVIRLRVVLVWIKPKSARPLVIPVLFIPPLDFQPLAFQILEFPLQLGLFSFLLLLLRPQLVNLAHYLCQLLLLL
jgi:hypothetical protein